MTALRAAVLLALLMAPAAALASDSGSPAVVYPSGPAVPENLLRIELRFATPLRDSLTIDDIKLLDGDGRAIESPFLDFVLPGADGMRVTVLLHPGRVKSGLRANVALGRALRAGTRVTLVVGTPEWVAPVQKSWDVIAPDVDPPQPARWTFDPPHAGSRDAIVLRLDGAISSAAERLIAIRAPGGDRVAGTTALEDGETVWRFVPAQPWSAGRFAVVVHPDLEDAAGNRPCGAFEAVQASRQRCEGETVRPFEPQPADR